MLQHFDLFIPGAAKSTETLTVYAPYDRRPIATVATADQDTVNLALNNAHSLFEDRSRWLTKERRLEILKKTAELMAENFEFLALEAAKEGGKPLQDSRVEVTRAIDGLQICIDVLRTASGSEIPMHLNSASAFKLAFTHYEPIGVVAAVSAFNHPVNLIVHQVAPAIAAGCPVIVKPAEDTPLSCFHFVRLLYQAGLPEEHCQCLMTRDTDTTGHLVTSPLVGFVSFIGSAKVGWMLRSKLAEGTRCALEHGGAAPVIVAEDADIDTMIPKLTKGGFYHAGQVCVSVQRVFVHQSIAGIFSDAFTEAVNALRVGDPELDSTDVGPLIRPGEVDRIESWVNEVSSFGTLIKAGGKRLSPTTFQPTLLYDPPGHCKVSQQEIFGPVVCIYPYDDIDEAIRRANALPFAFQASIFTKNIDRAMKAFNQLKASAVMINEHTAFRVDWMPFSGLKQSGLGIGGIPGTFRDMQIEKMMVMHSDALKT
ncbi:aldehyde dehydrogenase family protein [Nitrosomonas mobilis]|uniref:Aldehyde-dehydrogenase-like protein Y4uC n=1 Tax=Nitrosomonas mobilis TaxID=51642 RepID=A0A1G5SLE4_9PROT|nr:aldehyde dehydrogenase family protein [Nitrosomonas mobilis]SCZ87189.1 Aldehyde-dehydrogenase-like protein Y4uC [Nitrosomonas mobilis]